MSGIRTRVAAILIATASFVLAMSSVSSAEVGGFHVNVTPYAGFGTWGPGVNAEDKLMYGGRLGLGFGRMFGVEGNYGISSTETLAGNGTQAYTQYWLGTPTEGVDTDIKHWSVDALVHFAKY